MIRALLFLLFASQVFSATWVNDAYPCNFTRTNGSYNWIIEVVRSSDGVGMYNISTASNPGGATASTLTMTIPQQSTNYQFYIVVGAAASGLYSQLTSGNGEYKRWISSYQTTASGGTGQQISSSGPYANNGQPSGGNPPQAIYDGGQSANPANPTPPSVVDYEKTVTLVNSFAYTVYKQITMVTSADNVTIKTMLITLGPNQSKTVLLRWTSPFNYFVTDMVPYEDANSPTGISYSAASSSSSSGSGDPAYSGTPPTTPEAKETPGTSNPSAAQSAAATTTMAGGTGAATSKDIKDLDDNLKAEIQRGTEQTRTSGDQIRDAVANVDSTLNRGFGFNGGSVGGTSSVGSAGASVTAFTGSITSKAAGLSSSLNGLIAALGLGSGIGSGSLTWSVSVMGNSYTLSAEDGASYFDAVRTVFKWVMSIAFIWHAISIVRGAFVDEGGRA